MIRRTKEYILENKMIKNHSTVLVALSGKCFAARKAV